MGFIGAASCSGSTSSIIAYGYAIAFRSRKSIFGPLPGRSASTTNLFLYVFHQHGRW